MGLMRGVVRLIRWCGRRTAEQPDFVYGAAWRVARGRGGWGWKLRYDRSDECAGDGSCDGAEVK